MGIMNVIVIHNNKQPRHMQAQELNNHHSVTPENNKDETLRSLQDVFRTLRLFTFVWFDFNFSSLPSLATC